MNQQQDCRDKMQKRLEKKAVMNVCLLFSSETSVQLSNACQLKEQLPQVYDLGILEDLQNLGHHVEKLILPPDQNIAIGQLLKRVKTTDLFFNFYDIITPAYSEVLTFMERCGVPHIGPGFHFGMLSRSEFKKACFRFGIPTSPYIFAANEQQLQRFKQVGQFPLFVKHPNGLASVGVSEESVVNNFEELLARCKYIWKRFGYALIERYIDGDEFTVLVHGIKGNVKPFPSIKRVFPENQHFLTFDLKYGTNHITKSAAVQDKELDELLQNYSKQLFVDTESESYARLDFRQDKKTKKLYCLDYNPMCMCFQPDDDCSADQIRKLSGISRNQLMNMWIDQAFDRCHRDSKKNKYKLQVSESLGLVTVAKTKINKDELILSYQMEMTRVVSKNHIINYWGQDQFRKFSRDIFMVAQNIFVILPEEVKKWRPVDHSNDPNCQFIGLELFATQDIEEGQQLKTDLTRQRKVIGDIMKEKGLEFKIQ